MDIYFPDEEDVQCDTHLHKYWEFSCVPQYAAALAKRGPMTKALLIDQMVRSIFDVTAFHEFVGAAVEYTTDPAAAAFQVRVGESMANMQNFLLLNSLVVSTGMPMPMLVPSQQDGDDIWLYQLEITPGDPEKFERVDKVHETFMAALEEVSKNVRARNKSGERIHPFDRM